MEGKILFVDDEVHILKSLKRLFMDEPYEILTAKNPFDALQILDENQIMVVVSDHRMPDMDGNVFLEKVKEKFPDTLRIMMTGFADLEAALAAINQGNVYRFINKPWEDNDLKMAVRNALTHYQLAAENKRLFALTKEQNTILMDLNQNLEAKAEERTLEIRRLLQQLAKSFQQLIWVLVEIMELFNPALGGHAKRVNEFAEKITRQFKLEEGRVALIEQAALLHDIGLVGLPRTLLDKIEGALTKAELALIQQHPVLGDLTLRKIEDLKPAAAIVRSHHESFDGTGYPDRLKGDQISLEARIVRVANDFDHLINKRNMTIGDGLEYLRRKSGLDYDPRVVQQLRDACGGSQTTSEEEVALLLEEVQPGMILSRDIKTQTSLFLLAKNTRIETPYLERLHNYHQICPIVDLVYVYTSSIKQNPNSPDKPEDTVPNPL